MEGRPREPTEEGPPLIDEALIELLRPIVREVVREELRHEREQWRWLSVRQAAELLDVTPAAIHQRAARGKLVTRKLDGRLYVDAEELGRQLDDALP